MPPDTEDRGFHIWLDADAAPRDVKEILFRAARRREIQVVVVANRAQHVPQDPHIRFVEVSAGLDVADDHIVASCAPGDLVITADVPLAAAVIDRGATVIQPRGEVLDASNVGQRLSVRNFMDELRAGGLAGGGPPPFGQAERQRFANALDRLLTQRNV